MWKALLFVVGTTVGFLSISNSVWAGGTVDLSGSTNWNVRYHYGSGTTGELGVQTQVEDLDSDGKDDLILGAYCLNFNSRDCSGSIYIIYGDLVESQAGDVNLATSTNYNLRYDGADADASLGWGGINTADMDGDGLKDLIIGNPQGGVSAGYLYIIYGSLLDNYTGTGNNLDLSNSSTYNLRYGGSGYTGGFWKVIAKDIDGNSRPDLLVGSYLASNNSRSNSGSLYVIYDSLMDNYTGTGNNITITTSTNYNIRYDGAAASDNLGQEGGDAGDIDGDGRAEIIIDAPLADSNGANSGSVYVIWNMLIDDYTGTGNNVDLATSSNYGVRLIGAGAGDRLGDGVRLVDIDGNGRLDALMAASYADNNSRSTSGSVYVVKDSILGNYTNTGNDVGMGTSANYSLRYDGGGANDTLGYSWEEIGDVDGDGIEDLHLGASATDFNSRVNSGSVYVLFSGLTDNYSGTGNNIDLASTGNFSLRFDGAVASNNLGDGGISIGDIDGDGTKDWVLSSYISGIDYVRVIYNFAHAIALDNPIVRAESDQVSFEGDVDASDSNTNISGVQAKLDNSSFGSGWNDCTASDGSFDEKTEDFACTLSLLGASRGGHTVYFRSVDTNGVYTNISYLKQHVFYFQSEVPPTPASSSCASVGTVANIFVVRESGNAEVRWTPPSNASSAHIRYSDTLGEWKYAIANTVNDGVEAIGGLATGRNYYFEVVGVSDCGSGSWSRTFGPVGVTAARSPIPTEVVAIPPTGEIVETKNETGMREEEKVTASEGRMRVENEEIKAGSLEVKSTIVKNTEKAAGVLGMSLAGGGVAALGLSSVNSLIWLSGTNMSWGWKVGKAIEMTANMIWDKFSWLMASLGLAEIARKSIGVVFDSVTGKGIEGVRLLFYSKSGNIKTGWSGKGGRFFISAPEDEYQIQAEKEGYDFPSKVVTVGSNHEYANIYVAGKLIHLGEGPVSNVAIPMDQKRIGKLKSYILRIKNYVAYMFDKLRWPMWILGGGGVIYMSFVSDAIVWRIYLAIVAVGMAVTVYINGSKNKQWGWVTNKEGKASTYTRIDLWRDVLGRKEKYLSEYTDREGRYLLTPEDGDYWLEVVDKKGKVVWQKKVTVTPEKPKVNERVKIEIS